MSYRTYIRDSVYPTFRDPFFAEHLARYIFLRERVKGKRVLEVGCGKGYGSYLLASSAREVIALDLNTQSLQYATANYSQENLKFLELELTAQTKEQLGLFDVVVSFEVIEHLPPTQAGGFVENLKSVLSPEGVAWLSTPNHEVVTKSGVQVPEFHINNLKSTEFKGLLLKSFSHVEMFGQIKRKSPLYLALLFLDRWSLRHSVARRLKKQPSTTTSLTAKSVVGNATLDVNENDFAFFNDPPWKLADGPGRAQDFIFTPLIVKQAGMMVAKARL